MRKRMVLLSVLLIAIVFRVFKLSAVPSSLYIDEVAMVVDASLVANTGKDMHGLDWWQVIYPSYGDYKQSVYIWAAAFFMKLFGTSDWVVKLPSVLAGVGTTVVAGMIAVRLLDRTVNKDKVFLFTALVVAVAPWSVVFSRAAFEGHLAQFFFSLAMLCLVSSKKQWAWLTASVAFGVLSTYTYYSVRFVFPVVFVAFSVYQTVAVLKTKQVSLRAFLNVAVTRVILPLAVYFLLLMPLSTADFSREATQFRLSTDSVLKNEAQIIQSNVFREIAGNTTFDRVIFHRTWLTAKELLENISDHLALDYLFLSGDSNLRHGTGFHGVFLLGMFPFFLIGLYGLFKKQPAEGILLFIWWLAALLPASVPQTTPHALRSLNALVPLSVIIGYGMAYFYSPQIGLLFVKKYKFLYSLVFSGLTVLFVASVISFWQYYFVVYPQLSQNAWYYSQRQAAEEIARLRSDNQPIYSVGIGDKFYLWLIAYAGYRGKLLTSVEEKEFIFSRFDTVNDNVSLDAVPLDQPVVLAVSATQSEAAQKKFADRILESTNISVGKDEPQIIIYKLK